MPKNELYRIILWLNGGNEIWSTFMPKNKIEGIVKAINAKFEYIETLEMANTADQSVFKTATFKIAAIDGWRIDTKKL